MAHSEASQADGHPWSPARLSFRRSRTCVAAPQNLNDNRGIIQERGQLGQQTTRLVMKLRAKSQETLDASIHSAELKVKDLAPLTSGSNTSSDTAIGSDLTLTSPESKSEDDLPDSSHAEKKSEALVPKRKVGRRKRKSAEEKAANVRARNRRAQQAFRKRQKALSVEKSESMAFLQEEVEELRETNKVLQNTIDSLLQQLDRQEVMEMESINMDQPLLGAASMPNPSVQDGLTGPGVELPAILSVASIPDILTDDDIPNLLHGFDFGDNFDF